MSPSGHSLARTSDGKFSGPGELTAQQQAFVYAFASNGGDIVAAGTSAGIAQPGQNSHRVARLPGVMAAIRNELDGTVMRLIAMGLKTMEETLADTSTSLAVRAQKLSVTKALFLREEQRLKILAMLDQREGGQGMTKAEGAKMRLGLDAWRKEQERIIDITPVEVEGDT